MDVHVSSFTSGLYFSNYCTHVPHFSTKILSPQLFFVNYHQNIVSTIIVCKLLLKYSGIYGLNHSVSVIHPELVVM